jgi:hypothetical protein
MAKIPKLECLFCAGVEPIPAAGGAYSPADFTELSPIGSKKAWRKMQGGWRWKDYTIELFGHVYNVEPPEPPILNRKWVAWFQRIQHHAEDNQPLPEWTLFYGYRIKHKGGWEMLLHWWPTHELIFTVTNFKPENDFDSLTKFLKLLKPETRGNPKFNEIDLVRSMQKVGKDATLTAVAKELNVTRQALQFWARRGGMESWDKVKERYSNAELW